MRILVTGKTGQISQSLQMLAQEHGHDIIIIGRPEVDFENPYNLEAEIIRNAPDILISAAAYTMVDNAESNFEIAKKINVDAPTIIAEACKKIDIPLLHLSTDYVYKGDKNTPYVESDEVAPQSIYGKTKLAGEVAIRTIHTNHIILRTAWVYSPFGKNFVKTMLNLGGTREEISVVSDQFGCPTSALDIARALFIIAKKIKSDSEHSLRGIFHLAGKGETNWSGFTEKIFEYSNLSTKVKAIPSCDYPTPAKRPANSRLDCDKLSNIYKIELPLWQDALKECLNLLKIKA